MIEQKLKWERIKAGIVPLYLPERNQYWYDVRTLTRYSQTMLYKIGVTCLYKGHNVMFCTLVVITWQSNSWVRLKQYTCFAMAEILTYIYTLCLKLNKTERVFFSLRYLYFTIINNVLNRYIYRGQYVQRLFFFLYFSLVHLTIHVSCFSSAY